LLASSDLDIDIALPGCRWFTHGWTLQELIAAQHIFLLTKTGIDAELNTGLIATDLLRIIAGISPDVLIYKTPLKRIEFAQKMSWAAHR
jgi:hypothetical protein